MKVLKFLFVRVSHLVLTTETLCRITNPNSSSSRARQKLRLIATKLPPLVLFNWLTGSLLNFVLPLKSSWSPTVQDTKLPPPLPYIHIRFYYSFSAQVSSPHHKSHMNDRACLLNVLDFGIWNMPTNIRLSFSISLFKRSLKIFFSSPPFPSLKTNHAN